jgi:cation transport regulator ChaC
LAIFAYGSLSFQPGFAFASRQRVTAHGVTRSFSQASPDHRERAGYERMSLDVTTDQAKVRAVPLEELAEQMRNSSGPSGRNDDYVFQLEAALGELEVEDPLISALAAGLRR